MKIRRDFVTNSSSSSFVLAMHKDLTGKELDDIIEKNGGCISKFASLFDMTKKEVESEIKDEFMDMHPDLELGDWNISCGIASSDLGSLISMFIYSMRSEDTNHFKMRFGDYI